jgi:hypothetical protein
MLEETYNVEPTVAPDFPDRVRAFIEGNGGRTIFVALDLPREEQECRFVDKDRAAFGKMRRYVAAPRSSTAVRCVYGRHASAIAHLERERSDAVRE